MWKTNYSTGSVLLRESNNIFVIAKFIGLLSFTFVNLPYISDPAYWTCVSYVCVYWSLFKTHFFLSFWCVHILDLLLASLNNTSLAPLLDHICLYLAHIPPHSLLLPNPSLLFSFRSILNYSFNFEFSIGNLSVCMYSSPLLSSFLLLTSSYLKHIYIWMFH